MKKTLLLLALVAVFSLSGCLAGPHQTKRTVDDWDRDMYIDNPLLNGVLWVVPVFPLAYFGASIVDFFAVDAYHFWIKDLWDGKGTGFEHSEMSAEDGYLQSLLIDDAKFFEMKKKD
jgi:hypothetical protein